MSSPRWLSLFGFALLSVGTLAAQTEDRNAITDPDPFVHPDCAYFGPQRDRFVSDALRRSTGTRDTRLSRTTEGVTALLGVVPGGSRTYTFDQQHKIGTIDSYIFADLQKNNITPAPRTTDWEFVRRVSLDLTGRIPTADRTL